MNPLLSILVPVYNEERTLRTIMDAIVGACPDAQVVYIDDGSRDNSWNILKERARPQDLVLTKPNGGKGSAIRLGLEKAQGQFCVIQDADLEYDPAEIPTLLKEAQTHAGSVVFGSRFLQKNPAIYNRFLWGNKVLSGIMSVLFATRITDSYTCYKLLPTNVFRSLNLTSSGFEMEAEICAKCLRHGIPIREVAITYKPRRVEEGKKIRLMDAWKGLLMMMKIRVMKDG